jgi:ferredoxin-NADP reductase
LSRHLPPGYRRFQFFICGPGAMMDAVEEALVQLGVPPERVHTERFNMVCVTRHETRSDDAAGVAGRVPDHHRLHRVRRRPKLTSDGSPAESDRYPVFDGGRLRSRRVNHEGVPDALS